MRRIQSVVGVRSMSVCIRPSVLPSFQPQQRRDPVSKTAMLVRRVCRGGSIIRALASVLMLRGIENCAAAMARSICLRLLSRSACVSPTGAPAGKEVAGPEGRRSPFSESAGGQVRW